VVCAIADSGRGVPRTHLERHARGDALNNSRKLVIPLGGRPDHGLRGDQDGGHQNDPGYCANTPGQAQSTFSAAFSPRR